MLVLLVSQSFLLVLGRSWMWATLCPCLQDICKIRAWLCLKMMPIEEDSEIISTVGAWGCWHGAGGVKGLGSLAQCPGWPVP